MKHLFIPLFAFILLIASPANAERWNLESGFLSKSEAVIKGYDPVAYFTQGAPVKGNPDITSTYQGGLFYFASQEHKELFNAEPEKYAPQYGGYCAFAVAHGSKAGIDPEAWKIVDGKLYLNLNKNIQERWEGNIDGFISQANTNWPELQK